MPSHNLPIANNFLKFLVPAHASRQLTSPRECLHTARHIAHYISQKYINSIHITNKCNHVWVCNVVILEKIYTVNIKEVTYYASVFHLPCLSHTTLFHSYKICVINCSEVHNFPCPPFISFSSIDIIRNMVEILQKNYELNRQIFLTVFLLAIDKSIFYSSPCIRANVRVCLWVCSRYII
jgi:hypothetical protein